MCLFGKVGPLKSFDSIEAKKFGLTFWKIVIKFVFENFTMFPLFSHNPVSFFGLVLINLTHSDKTIY